MQDFADCGGVQDDLRAIAFMKAQLRQRMANALPFLRHALLPAFLTALRFDFSYRCGD